MAIRHGSVMIYLLISIVAHTCSYTLYIIYYAIIRWWYTYPSDFFSVNWDDYSHISYDFQYMDKSSKCSKPPTSCNPFITTFPVQNTWRRDHWTTWQFWNWWITYCYRYTRVISYQFLEIFVYGEAKNEPFLSEMGGIMKPPKFEV